MNEAINERLDAARAELLAALEAHLAFPPHGGNVRGRADSHARVDAASAEVERLRKAMRLLGNAPEAAHAPAPGESVEAYARRYQALAVEARRAPDAELWCLTLSSDLQHLIQQVRLARAPPGQGILALPRFDDALALALECQRTIPPTPQREEDGATDKSSSSKKKKTRTFTCEKHGQNFTHATADCRMLQLERKSEQGPSSGDSPAASNAGS